MKLREFNVMPNIPDRLKPLMEIAFNLWWVWDSEAFAMFREIDPDLWSATSHNPVKMLYLVPQERLNVLASDEGFIFRLDSVLKRFKQYLVRPAWFEKVKNSLPENFLISYFSLEFGLAECLPVYSGGLGVLAGDHLKSASDLGLSFVAVGLMYSEGYFSQYLTNDGWQQERFNPHNYHTSPVIQVKNPDGKPVMIELKYPHGVVKAQVWKVAVGRISLFLLDANIPDNQHADREITARLYGGDLEMRVKQEYLLGIGGMQALAAMGLTPSVTHMNEGHSAFLNLERIRQAMEKHSMSFPEARETVAASSVFTTHTPVPAGNDRFPVDLLERYLRGYVEQGLKISWNEFIKLGRVNPDDANELFCMTVLALKLSYYNNGVSKLHGVVSRNMWKEIWPGVPTHEIPITSITNGVHANSWVSKEMSDLFYRYLGTRWVDNPDDHSIWEKVDEIPDTELWNTHNRRKERLVAFVRRKLKKQLKERGASKEIIEGSSEVLNPDILTIGFARRFATYKRATLLFRDIERLSKILNNAEMPVQIIFAGKAHPKDDNGKAFIKQIVHMAGREDLRHRVVFVEDYALNTANYLVQGVDVWLNNPKRPLEASGTSGMKVNFNGGLNFSTLDGWWDERADADNGWNIGRGEEYEDDEYQMKIEANSLYETLENDIVPLYYKRGKDGLAHEWIKKMKTSMRTLCPEFNTHRMVMEYTERFYKPAGHNFADLSANNFAKARELKNFRDKIAKKWDSVKILEVSSTENGSVTTGAEVRIRAVVDGAGLAPGEIAAEIYVGYDRGFGDLADTSCARMLFKEGKDKSYVFEGAINPSSSGKLNYAVRVLPSHPDLKMKFIPNLIKWSEI